MTFQSEHGHGEDYSALGVYASDHLLQFPKAKDERDSHIPFASVAELEGLSAPEREWLVPGLIPDHTVTMLSGDGGTGKSLLALQLAWAVATETNWIGQPVRNGPALFFSAEDDQQELHRRLEDISISTGIRMADASGLHVASLAGSDALLAILDRKTNTLATTPLYDDLVAHMAAVMPSLLVLDTLADLTAGDENNRAHARQFIGFLRGLAIRHRCAVVLLSHPSLTGISSGTGSSGSTAWNGSVRSRLYLERIADEGHEPNPDARRLTNKKANYGRTGGEIGLTWQTGVFVADKPENGLDRMATSAKAERVFLRLLDEHTEQGRWVSPNPSNSFAPAVFASHPKAEGITKRAFRTTMENLFSQGVIEIGNHGRGASQKQHVQRASNAKNEGEE